MESAGIRTAGDTSRTDEGASQDAAGTSGDADQYGLQVTAPTGAIVPTMNFGLQSAANGDVFVGK